MERFHLDNLTTLFVNFNASFTILPLELIVQITVNSRIKFPIHLTSYLHYQIRNAFLRYRNTLIFLNHFYIFVIYYNVFFFLSSGWNQGHYATIYFRNLFTGWCEKQIEHSNFKRNWHKYGWKRTLMTLFAKSQTPIKAKKVCVRGAMGPKRL